MRPHVAALLTCHNRRRETIACLSALETQQLRHAVLSVYVVDAASSDGTPEAIERDFPAVTLIRAKQDTYWNQGMRTAFEAAAAIGFDYYLWLNDDTFLDPPAVQAMLDGAAAVGRTAIIVGTTRDPTDGAYTYGGVTRPAPRMRPLRFRLIEPRDRPIECETMNGNCVLIPHAVAQEVGQLDPAFTHAMGDYDYGLRARRSGIPVMVCPGTVGTCQRNPNPALGSVRQELRSLRGVKGLPPKEWLQFCRRWAGPFWPAYAASPYVRRVVRALRSQARRHASVA